jgi:hypothetical protein
MAVVHDKHGGGEDDSTLYVDTVLGRYLTPGTYAGDVINHDRRLNLALPQATDVEPRILPDDHRTTNLNSVRNSPSQIAGVMDGQVVASGRERVG